MYAVACVALAAIAGWNYQQNQKEIQLIDITLEDVDALASGESSTNKRLAYKGEQTCCASDYNDGCSRVSC